VLEKIPFGTEVQEEEEEESVRALHPQSLHSRGPAILAEAEPAVESAATEGPVEEATTAPEDTTNVETHICSTGSHTDSRRTDRGAARLPKCSNAASSDSRAQPKHWIDLW